MNVNALDIALEEYLGKNTEVSVTLRDSAMVRGRIKDFDGYVILLSGEPDLILYRHSVLKLTEAVAPRVHERVQEKVFQPRRQPPPSKPPRKRPAGEQAARPPREQAEKPGQMGTLGEAMQKWLESQKGK
ncbi:MAG TPA: RNA chaperone Hfq [Nitrospirota bacterium]|nr:RNA chaperone Hfq [Nitrospirota bacterium]